jgi:hypothetical protein
MDQYLLVFFAMGTALFAVGLVWAKRERKHREAEALVPVHGAGDAPGATGSGGAQGARIIKLPRAS